MADDLTTRINSLIGNVQQVTGAGQAVGDLFGFPGVFNSVLGNVAPRGKFSIQEFKSALSSYDGLLKNNLFLCQIMPPRTMAGASAKDIILFCDQATIPAVRFSTDEGIVRNGYGPAEHMPYKPQFTELQLSFYGDGRGMIHTFFQEWINSIVNFDLRNGYEAFSQRTGMSPFEVNYKEDYSTQIQVVAYNDTQNNIIEVEMFEAFPINIDDIQLNWGSNDEIMKINVRFAYTYYVSKSTAPQILSGSPTSILGLLQKGASIAQTISTIKKPQSIGDFVNVVNNANVIKNGVFGIKR